MLRLLTWFFVVLLFGGAWSAGGIPPETSRKPDLQKSNLHVGQNPGTPDGREGGETIASAIPCDGIPFTDGGNTCDNLHDYDEACPYTGSTAPDVVYSFTPAVDISLDLSLCSDNNQYDTKIFIYQDLATPGDPWACNDDYCANAHTYYASYLEDVPAYAGHTYFIVIDGYGGDCGQYELEITEWVPCVVVPPCPENAVPEGEPPLVDFYDDAYNGGCCCETQVWQEINWIDPETGCGWLCGVSGWFYYYGAMRDTDWFEVTAAGDQIDWTLDAEFRTNMFVLSTDCHNLQVLYSAVEVGPCDPQTLSFPTIPGEIYWLWVGPTDFLSFDEPFEFDYLMEVCGITYDVVTVVPLSWGALKETYR